MNLLKAILLLLWLTLVCAIGVCAALVGWRWLDAKCQKAIE